MTREGYGRAYERGYDLTVRFLLSREVQRISADDVAQSGWAKGWDRLSQLRNDRMVVTWVSTIALNSYRRLAHREPLKQPLLDQHLTVGIDLAAIDMAHVLKLCRP